MRKFLDSTAPPIQDPVIDPKTGRMTNAWQTWFGRMPDTLSSIPNIINTVSLTAQSASIGATDFTGTRLLPGLYRARYYARITTAAGVSSSLDITISWTDGGAACSFSGAAMTGNTTSTVQSGSQVIRCDEASAVNYSTTYASNPAGAMTYSLDVVLERIKA